MSKYEQYVEKRNLVSSTTLADQEGRVVTYAGALTTQKGDIAAGVVETGNGASEASVIYSRGHCEAYCDGAVSAIAVGDPLTPDGTSSPSGTAANDGVFVKGTVGTHHIRAIALEALIAANTKIKIDLIG